ncbi:helix-turn-helix domain-containing protein [Caenispirillum bisanense]|uniref:DUF2442 domain-containing protein n=1 Tax=Caenispirillum bisanense TaxID=414052 RepID=A0A286H1U2_9PROT|nr:hypothetical protein [Caenispirillum bisanense]SOE01672.1 hypothetical protein SAMN05421508_12121 [Caenispirillum bisanense]
MFKPGETIPRFAAVEAVEPDTLDIVWDDGRSQRVSLAGWIAANDLGPVFAGVRRFGDIRVIDYGTAIQWGEDDELTIDNLHVLMIGQEQQELSAGDIGKWQESMHVSNQEAADLIGVRVSTWHNYKSGETRIPKGTQIALRAMLKDPVVFEAHYRPRRAGRPAKSGSGVSR